MLPLMEEDARVEAQLTTHEAHKKMAMASTQALERKMKTLLLAPKKAKQKISLRLTQTHNHTTM